MNPEIKFEDFEYAVMSKLLAGDDPVLACLREQYKNAHIEKREFTGVGFFTDFSFKNLVPNIENKKNFHIGDVAGTINDTSVDFVLFIRNGVLEMLEGVTFGGEPWPECINSLKLDYWDGENRNLERLQEECFKK
jgi:hypothetical protein